MSKDHHPNLMKPAVAPLIDTAYRLSGKVLSRCGSQCALHHTETRLCISLPFFIPFIANIARKRPELNCDKTITSTLETSVLVRRRTRTRGVCASLQGLHLADHRRVYNPLGDASITKRASRQTSTAICRTTRCPSRTLFHNILPARASLARGTDQRQAHHRWLGAGLQEFGGRYISSSSSKSPQISCRENSTSTSP
jgi:hypothetical protein